MLYLVCRQDNPNYLVLNNLGFPKNNAIKINKSVKKVEQLMNLLFCLTCIIALSLGKDIMYLPVGTIHTAVTRGQREAIITAWGPGGQGGAGDGLIAGGGGGSGAVVQNVSFRVSVGYTVVTIVPLGILIGHVPVSTVVQILDANGNKVGSVTVDAGQPGAAGVAGSPGLAANCTVTGASFNGTTSDGAAGGIPGSAGADFPLPGHGSGGQPGGASNKNGGGGAGGFSSRPMANGGIGATPRAPGSNGIPGSGGPGAGGGAFNSSNVTQPSTAFGLGGPGGVILTLV